MIGPYSMSDTSLVPGAVCAYERVSDEFEYLRWMKVKAPQVWAADRNSDKRESRIVSWRFELQKNIGPGYSTVGKSPVQRARAYEDQPAPLTAKRVYFDSEAVSNEYIAQVTIKWHKRDGSVEGKVRLRMQFYGNKTHPGAVHEGFCPGGAQYV